MHLGALRRPSLAPRTGFQRPWLCRRTSQDFLESRLSLGTEFVHGVEWKLTRLCGGAVSFLTSLLETGPWTAFRAPEHRGSTPEGAPERKKKSRTLEVRLDAMMSLLSLVSGWWS